MVLHTCVDLDDAVLAECRDLFGALHIRKDFEGAINDPEVDMICLATTEKLRLPVIALAAKAGKATYVEKPLATSLEEMRQIQRVVIDAGIPFCVGHNRRASPAMLDAQRIFRGHITHPQPCPWRWRREGDHLPTLPDDGVPSISVRINDDWYSWKGLGLRQVAGTSRSHALRDDTLHGCLQLVPCGRARGGNRRRNGNAEPGRHRPLSEWRALATIVLGNNGTLGYCKELYEFMGNGAYLAVDHMLEVRTAGIVGRAARTTYPMVHDRHPQIGVRGRRSGLARQEACRMRRGSRA